MHVCMCLSQLGLSTVFHKPFEGIYAKFMALMHLGTNELIRF